MKFDEMEAWNFFVLKRGLLIVTFLHYLVDCVGGVCLRNHYELNGECFPCGSCPYKGLQCDDQCYKWNQCHDNEYYDRHILGCRPCFECQRDPIAACRQCSDDQIKGKPNTVAIADPPAPDQDSKDKTVVTVIAIVVGIGLSVIITITISVLCIIIRKKREQRYRERGGQHPTDEIPLNVCIEKNGGTGVTDSSANGRLHVHNSPGSVQNGVNGYSSTPTRLAEDRAVQVDRMNLQEDPRAVESLPAHRHNYTTSYSLTGEVVCQPLNDDIGSFVPSPPFNVLSPTVDAKLRDISQYQSRDDRPYRTFHVAGFRDESPDRNRNDSVNTAPKSLQI